MTSNEKGSMTRREFATRSALAAAAIGSGLSALTPGRALAADDALITEIASNEMMITTLGYVNETPKPDQSCANCVLYTGPAEGSGKCALFQQGAVAAKGWCKSWAAKPPTP